jgi:hypothetical protein
VIAACGGDGRIARERTDLRSPDVDARMDPVSHPTVFACAGARRLEAYFDPTGTVALIAGGRPLAYGTAGTRAVSRGCAPLGRLRGVPTGALRERDAATTLTCTLPPSVRLELHPLGDNGSTVAVLSHDLRRILLSAVLTSSGSRILYAAACHAGPPPSAR